MQAYILKERIHDSSNTLIFRGVEKEKSKNLIIKVLKNWNNVAAVVRFKQEVEILRGLYDCSGVIKIYDFLKHEQTLMFTMEDIDGISLNLIKHSLNIQEILDIMIKLTETLAMIHSHSILHRDLNPSNIVVNRQTKEVKIIDFTHATKIPSEKSTLADGTLAYMSPESTGRMNRSVDYRSDFYSLGVTLYELLTGRLPF